MRISCSNKVKVGYKCTESVPLYVLITQAMLRILPGSLRNHINKDNLLNDQNSLSELAVKGVLRKILKPTGFTLSEMLEEPVIGESLCQIITSSPKWRRYIDRVADAHRYQGSVKHSHVHGFFYCCINRCLPRKCFLQKTNINVFRLYILFAQIEN